jgi:hypothetical protein
MAKKIKVKDITKGPSTCQHYRLKFDKDGADDGTIVTAHAGAEMTEEEERQFLELWVKYQFKEGADKVKLKNKTVIDVEV